VEQGTGLSSDQARIGRLQSLGAALGSGLVLYGVYTFILAWLYDRLAGI